MDPLVIMGILLFVGMGLIGYRIIYPTEVQMKNIPVLTLAKPAPLELSPPANLHLDTSDAKPLSVTTSGISIPLKGPEKIDLTPPPPIKIDYGNPPRFDFNDPNPINFGPPPVLRVSEIPPLSVSNIPPLSVSEISPLRFSEPPNLSIAPTTLSVAPIPSIQWSSELPKMNFNTPPNLSITPTTLSVASIPPIQWSSELPKMQFGDVPVMRLIKSNPCEGIGNAHRDVGPDCFDYIWKEAGCSKTPEYSDYHRKRTKLELIAEATLHTNIYDPDKRSMCYGDNWFDYAPVEVFAIQGKPTAYMPQEYWTPILAKYGWRRATYAELRDAQAHGAEWCMSGFMADGPNAWPRQTLVPGCGGPPLAIWTPIGGNGGCTVVGKKPPQNAIFPDFIVLPFNGPRNRWSKYDRPTLAPRGTCEYAKAEYLRKNPDVITTKMDAWDHYTTYGKNEISTNPNRKWPGISCPTDMGMSDKPRGWYDMQNQGVNNDYCRWVGDASNSWFSCLLAGSDQAASPKEIIYNDANPHELVF
jgi:hypothetical protein